MPVLALRIAVAINPQASFGRRRDVGPRVVDELRAVGHTVYVLQEENIELLRLSVEKRVRAGIDVLVVVGGDGMVSLGANIVAGTAVPLAIVACGTGNDVARGLGIPTNDVEKSVLHLLEGLKRPPHAIDAVQVRHGDLTTWFVGALSAGFDAVVNERANQMTRPSGKSRYICAMLRELLTLRPITYRVSIDGVAGERRAMLISVANNVSIGGGMKIAPEALIDDGMLDLFIVKPLSRMAFLRLFPKVFSGTHTQHPAIELVRCRSVRIDADGVVAYADGERIGALPVQVEIVPGAVRIFA